MGAKDKKPFVLLGGKPLVSYALLALDRCASIDGIIIASEKSCVEKFITLIKRLGLRKVIDVVVGGKTRTISVRNCLRRADPSFGIVLIHDAARPFVDKKLIDKAVRTAKRTGACISALPESDTVKLAGRDNVVKKTLDRRRVFRAQTPQAFRRDVIERAYAAAGRASTTDDSGLAEKIGAKVSIIEGTYRNIKITTKEDLKLAEVLL